MDTRPTEDPREQHGFGSGAVRTRHSPTGIRQQRARGDPRGTHVARHRVRLDADQGLPDRRGSGDRPRGRQPFLGERVRRQDVDVLARRCVVGTPVRVCGSGRRRRPPLRRAAARIRRHRRLGDDARLPRIRCRGGAAGAVPHLAQHDDRARGERAHRGVRGQHPAALVDRPPAPGRPRRGAARPGARLRHDARRLRALEAHRPQGARGRRRVGDVPDRRCDARLRRGPAGPLRPAGGRSRAGARSRGAAARGPGRRRPGR